MAEVTTNFRDSNQGDLGKNLVSKEYLISVYPKIADQILPKEIFYTGSANNPIVVTSIFGAPVPFRNAGGNILRQEWKTFATKSSGYVSAGIKNDGTLWSWGYRCLGNLTSTIGATTPIQEFTSSTNWKQIHFSQDQSNNRVWAAAVKTDGSLWSWGTNGYGVFGNNTLTDSTTPIREFTSSTNWKQVACTNYSTIAIKTDGSLWGWGESRYGTLGNGDPIGIFFSPGGSRTPVRIGVASNWKSISCSEVSCVALTTNNKMYGWGQNIYGTIGITPLLGLSTPNQYILGPTTWTTPTNQNFPETFSSGTDTSAISNGGLYSWGQNRFGGIGVRSLFANITSSFSADVSRSSAMREHTSSTNWRAVSSGTHHTAALKTDGSLWLWGWDNSGQLARGPGGTGASSNPTPVQEYTSNTNWTSISCGGSYTAALKSDGSLWSVGNNSYGQSGINDTISRNTFVREFTSSVWTSVYCGHVHIAALKSDGSLWTWGTNSAGQLGVNDTITRSTPVREFTSSVWTSVSCGFFHTAAIKTDGSLWSWGRNTDAQLGNFTTINSLTPVREFTSSTNWIQSSCGRVFTAAIKSDGSLWSWGRNTHGQLGINASGGSTQSFVRSTPVREFTSSINWKSVKCSFATAQICAMKTDGTLWAWGDNYNGITGLNNRLYLFTPTLEYTNSNWKSIDTSGVTLGIKANGTLWRFGYQTVGAQPEAIIQENTYQIWSAFANPTASSTAYALTSFGRLYSANRFTSPFSLILASTDALWSQLFNSSGGYIYLRKTS